MLNHLNFYLTDTNIRTEKKNSIIVFCKYKKQQNVTPATHSKKVGTEATETEKVTSQTVLEGSTISNLDWV